MWTPCSFNQFGLPHVLSISMNGSVIPWGWESHFTPHSSLSHFPCSVTRLCWFYTPPPPTPSPPSPVHPPNPRRLYLISAYSSFSTVETLAKNFIISCLKYWTTSCLPASHCQGDSSKDTCQLYYCLVWNVSQFPTSFSIKPTLFSMACDTLDLPPVAYLFGKNQCTSELRKVSAFFVLWKCRCSTLLFLEISPTPRRFLFTSSLCFGASPLCSHHSLCFPVPHFLPYCMGTARCYWIPPNLD